MASSSDESELCGECKQQPSSDSFMVQCDGCDGWFHGKCCSLTEWQAAEFDIFHCKTCTKQRGPSKRKVRINWHRHDPYETGADSKPVQCGTVSFMNRLKNRHLPDAAEVVTRLPNGFSLTRNFFENNGFARPIVVENAEGLNMSLPDPTNFCLEKVVQLLGEKKRIDIIDSERQLVFESTLGFLRNYYAEEKREKVYNVISLEFTGTKMEEMVSPPLVIRELSWLPAFWPASEHFARFTGVDCPKTDRFLLLSAAGAYTDNHVDFGGSSVWYHVLRGSKVLYLSPPSVENLQIYENWFDANNRVDRFLGDEIMPCYRLSLSAGQTLFLPGGWIHAVVTPSDSLVFGGNFLHSLDISMQLRVFDLEQRIHCDPKFLFPEFHSVCFFAARHLSEQLRDLCEDIDRDSARKDAVYSLTRSASPVYLALVLAGCDALLTALRQWITDDKCMKRCVLSATECSTIASELNRSIRLAEMKKGLPSIANLLPYSMPKSGNKASSSSANKRRRSAPSSSSSSSTSSDSKLPKKVAKATNLKVTIKIKKE